MRASIRDTEIFFDVEGASLVIDENGCLQTKPIAFVIHGGPGADHLSYKSTFSPLSNKLQLIYFDLRGQGRSARGPKETYTLENNVEDMEALRQYLGLEKIIPLGTSYGGMVALSYAVRYPENVAALIVIATAATSRFLERAKEILKQRGTKEQKNIAEYLWNGNFANEEQLKKYFEVMQPLYSQGEQSIASTEMWNQTILSVDAINVAFGGFLRHYNILNQLGKITVPTLVIGGGYDWICPPEFSEEIAQFIPNSTLRIFSNSGHLVRLDEPELLRKEVLEFLTVSCQKN